MSGARPCSRAPEAAAAGERVALRLLAFFPAALFVSMLTSAAASSNSEWARSGGATAKWIALGVLFAFELPFVALGPRRWLGTLRPGVLHVLLAALGALALASVAWSADPGKTILSAGALAVALAVIGGPAWRYARFPGGPRSLALAALAASATVALAGFVLVPLDRNRAVQPSLVSVVEVPIMRDGEIVGRSVKETVVPERFRGALENPNTIAMYGFLAAPLALAFALQARLWPWVGAAASLAGALVAVEVVLSGSRGGMIAMAVAAFFCLFASASMRRHRLRILAATGLLVLALGALVAVSDSLRSFLGRGPSLLTLGGRTESWSAAWELAADQPLNGHGFGRERGALSEYVAAHPEEFTLFPGGLAENSYLGMLVNLGFPGAALLAFLVLGLLVTGAGAARLRDWPAPAFIGVVAGGATLGLTLTYLYSPGNVVMLAFWILGVAAWSRGSDHRHSSAR